jgi:excisionase family DNA binding protein
MMIPKLLNAKDIAESLGISKAKAYQLMQRGDISTIRSGRSVRVLQEDYFKYIESNRTSNNIFQLNTKSAAPTTDLDPYQVNPTLQKEFTHE